MSFLARAFVAFAKASDKYCSMCANMTKPIDSVLSNMFFFKRLLNSESPSAVLEDARLFSDN